MKATKPPRETPHRTKPTHRDILPLELSTHIFAMMRRTLKRRENTTPPVRQLTFSF